MAQLPSAAAQPATRAEIEEILSTLTADQLEELMSTLAPATPEPFERPTVVEIDVPSGRLVVSDDLRSVPAFNIDPPESINHRSGLDAWARVLANQAGVAYAFVGNSSPRLTRRADGTLVVVELDYDEDLQTGVLLDGETPLGRICTDLWAVMMVDHDRWTAAGGPPLAEATAPDAVESFFSVEVTPGRYRWTAFSHDDRFSDRDPGRHEFAHLTLIEAL